MGVIGHWRRSALGAGGVAMLLPLGLAVGLALTTTFGGRDGLHALAQVFSGPTAPGAPGRSEAPGLESARGVPQIPVAPRRHHVRPVTPTLRRTTAPARGSAPATAPTHHTTTTPVHHPTGGGGTGTPATPAPPPSSPPPPQHSAVHNTGQKVADQTKQLPAPVGSVAGGAVQTVVDLIP